MEWIRCFFTTLLFLWAAMGNSAEDIDQINKRCYNHLAGNWDRFPFAAQLPKMIRNSYLPSLGNQVLDIGSGTGMLAEWLQKQGFDVRCIDPSEEMVRRCSEKGLDVCQARIQDFYTDREFALVFAVLSLIHVPKKQFPAQIEKIATWLPRKGTLILAMIEGPREGIEERQGGFPRFFAKYTMDELEDLTKASFDVQERHTLKGPVTYLLLVLKKR